MFYVYVSKSVWQREKEKRGLGDDEELVSRLDQELMLYE